MPEWMAVLIGAGAVVIAQALTAAFVYGQLSQMVKELDRRVLRLEGYPVRHK